MRRLLVLWVCVLTAYGAEAREPQVRFDLPYTVEHGYYVVWLDTPVGPRRFLFDTGFSETAISESLCRELRTTAEESRTAIDIEGYKATIERVRLDSLRMGTLTFRDKTVAVLPDSIFLIRCFDLDGVAGSDLLQGLAVRFPNADSTIAVTNDVRAFGKPDRKYSCPIYKSSVCPYIPLTLATEGRRHRTWALFDTGSTGYFACDMKLNNPVRDIAADVERTQGYPSSFGLTQRVELREIIRGRIPVFTVAGAMISDMPFRATSGHNVIGGALLEWGQVIVDYRDRRFYFLPREGAELRVERQQVPNIMPTYIDGQLVVGSVWDEALCDVVAPGDKIVSIGDEVGESLGFCRFLRGEVCGKGKIITVEHKDGSRVTVPYNSVLK